MKAIASIFLCFFRFFGVTLLVVLPDLAVFFACTAQQGCAVGFLTAINRFLYTYSVTAPIIFFFTYMIAFIDNHRRSVAENAVEISLSAAATVFSLLLFLWFTAAAEPTHALLFSDYCLVSTAPDCFFSQSGGIPLLHWLPAEAVVLFPSGTFTAEAFRLAQNGAVVFFVCSTTLYFLIAVCVRFCCRSRWPLFNLAVCLIVFYVLVLMHRLWLELADRFSFSAPLFAVVITLFNLLSAAALIFLLRRRKSDSLF